MKIYVGNMNYDTNEAALEGLFSNYGEVADVAVITDRETGRPRGFGFVTMPNDQEAQAAITDLNGQPFEGRTLTVNEARPKGSNGGGSYAGASGGASGGGGGYRGDIPRW